MTARVTAGAMMGWQASAPPRLLSLALGLALAHAGPTHAHPLDDCRCSALRPHVRGDLTCDVAAYDFSWGNKICAGILPECVLRPRDAQDVAAAVLFARRASLDLSYRSGGHSYTCNSIKPHSVHLDLRSLRSVALRPATSGAGTELVLGPGNTQADLLDALAEGQMIVHGQCPGVGAGGLFLHGGYHTTLTLKYGRGNDTVTALEVVTADGVVRQLDDLHPHDGLWQAMRQAGSSFAIATRIVVKVIDDFPADVPLDLPRVALLDLLDNASHTAGLPGYFHVNGVDLLAVSASREWENNKAWLEEAIGRKLSWGETARSKLMATGSAHMSRQLGANKRFGNSGEIPYSVSSQDAYATVTFAMAMECYTPEMKAVLADVPEHRDPDTDLGCYLQITSTYLEGMVMVDFNCAYDSAFYQAEQRKLNQRILALCPKVERYYNTPSSFLGARDYFPNYDELAAIKARWDPEEVFRVYQGIRPTGLPPDTYEFSRPYTRTRSVSDWLHEKMWDVLARTVLNNK
ncbi:hypothetical protein AB1Y20_005815 [Prymnesium parvum]|uniref:FAD-binding PCMH-type domain-containing protein n=1 Tax=Prymnesium parvum TaxID=97485 RepID=A0AB34J295_PRYPA